MRKFILLVIIFVCCTNSKTNNTTELERWNTSSNYMPPSGYVPDEETAKKIAEAIWLPIYGKSIYDEKPYQAILVDDSIWIVAGTLRKGYVGGTAYIEIQKTDCKILKVIHGK